MPGEFVLRVKRYDLVIAIGRLRTWLQTNGSALQSSVSHLYWNSDSVVFVFDFLNQSSDGSLVFDSAFRCDFFCRGSISDRL